MNADVMRRAAALMQERADSNTCCGDIDCDDNWYARFLTSVADWLDECAQHIEEEPDHTRDDEDRAFTVARAYSGESS